MYFKNYKSGIMNFKKLCFSILLAIIFISCALAEKGHQIEVQVHGLQDTTAFLAYHYGNRQYAQDTVLIDNNGKFVFQGAEKLDPGMYMVVLPGQMYFEILLDNNQTFGIETTHNEFVNTMKFENSPDNEAFYNYMKFLRNMGEQNAPYRIELQDSTITEARRIELRQLMAEADQMVKEEQNRIIKKFPDGLFAKILLAQQEPTSDETRLLEDGTPDKEYMYQHYKTNFWNNIDFSDDRLVRTPILHAKLNQYFTRVIIQIPDSIIVEADRLLQQADIHPEIFKYIVFFITNTFERSQIMGMDRVFVYMVENYYMSGKADWVSEEQLEKITERAMALKPLLIGNKAPDINMFTPNQSNLNLYSVDSRFTILYFWDSECGHCKRNSPKLKELYSKMKDKGVEVFAVNTEPEREKWLAYIEENEYSWINVNDPYNRSGFRDKYDIWATPLIFLLDKDKKIIAKKITVEQTEEIINHELLKP
jgi:thiol-disulfide isomerase/thioredoxin